MNIATKQLQERQRRYKANYDQRIQHIAKFTVGGYVYIRKEAVARRDQERQKAPQSDYRHWQGDGRSPMPPQPTAGDGE